jgi:hypothetical protein
VNLFFRAIRFLYTKVGLNFREQAQNEKLKGPRVFTCDESNAYFKKVIDSVKPAMLSRLGTPESNCLLNGLQIQKFDNSGFLMKADAIFRSNYSEWQPDVKENLRDLVGFFPTTHNELLRFCDIYSNGIKNVDAIGIWGFVPGENHIINLYCQNAVKFDPVVLDTYFFLDPWTSQQRSKNVLVFHPF